MYGSRKSLTPFQALKKAKRCDKKRQEVVASHSNMTIKVGMKLTHSPARTCNLGGSSALVSTQLSGVGCLTKQSRAAFRLSLNNEKNSPNEANLRADCWNGSTFGWVLQTMDLSLTDHKTFT